ncbi:hypothetical protein [Quisquiliibacterium transsilvanicum]|uniref:DUF1640 domain-containing protein n=1 Tax=Quisquiliibacterium transsilvanicum TaxID=1549638 RepID=A0A7W8M7W1_9BURK|nr:hypothetical protein [Quisquiliibacterium transsilvanicum]MBB5271406.1 hypothetical protein [Quisquiliibacterium transsilvanicum]
MATLQCAAMLIGMGSFNFALLDALLSAGVAPDRARQVVDLFDRSVDERYGLHAQVLATKRDLAELETRLVREIAENRVGIAAMNERIAETHSSIAGTHARIAETNARIAETRADLIKWMLAALTAQTALLLGALRLF